MLSAAVQASLELCRLKSQQQCKQLQQVPRLLSSSLAHGLPLRVMLWTWQPAGASCWRLPGELLLGAGGGSGLLGQLAAACVALGGSAACLS
jgi:hypothetical protein